MNVLTSDYFERVVDLDKPVLVVGPGLRDVSVRDGWLPMPMDMGLVWFAEKMARRKGRIDVFDIPPKSVVHGCHHGIDQVEQYMKDLAKLVKLAEVRYIGGISRSIGCLVPDMALSGIMTLLLMDGSPGIY